MFAHVRLLNGYSQLLTYKVPAMLIDVNLVGKIVQVPIRNRVGTAVVMDVFQQLPTNITFAVKEITALEPFPNDPHYQQFIAQLTIYYQIPQHYLLERVRHFIEQAHKRTRKRKKEVDHHHVRAITLTDEQQAVVDFVAPAIIEPRYTPTLVHGVTGSGKTEIYKNLITTAIQQGKSVLLMLPEVTLAVQFERIMRAQLPSNIAIFSFHSATLSSDKRAMWQRLIEQQPMLVIGVHLPILLPIANLGLIIVDEEHEVGYQEKKHPKINSKEAAIWRAHQHNIPIVLGSATPSISSLYNVHHKNWHFFVLKKRFAGALPTIKTVLLSDKKERKSFWISQLLEDALRERLQRGEQAIVFLNRRGYSFFVQCKACTYIFSCTTCSVSLTLHGNDQLSCHYCGFVRAQPPTCPQCKVGSKEFLKKGIGTQQVVSVLEKLLPHARIGRADMDVSSNKKMWQKTLHDFQAGNLDILVGTQTIAKGFHFPQVTLVGIIWADLNLNFPIFNASETTLQQLIQVAGRAGRAREGAEVIVQAMAEHPIFNYLNEIDYRNFYEQEVASRAQVGYPPCARLAEIELKHTDEKIIESESHQLTAALHSVAKQYNYALTILGPAKPAVYKVKNMQTRKIYIKGQKIQEIMQVYAAAVRQGFGSRIYFTPGPVR